MPSNGGLRFLHRRDRRLSRHLCVCRPRNRIAASDSFQCDRASDGGVDLQQLREALPGDQEYKFLLHDRHKTFSAGLDEEVERWAIAVLKSPAHAPTANAFCERLIGSIRRECLDYLIPLNESHLKRMLREWVRHYSGCRSHQSLGPGIPDQVERTLQAVNNHKPVSRNRRVIAKSILGGLHYGYRWANAA
jgi:putative transposase